MQTWSVDLRKQLVEQGIRLAAVHLDSFHGFLLKIHVELQLAAGLRQLDLARAIDLGQVGTNKGLGFNRSYIQLRAKRDISFEIVKTEAGIDLLEV